jgi:solute carrier family 35 protein F1/2
MEISHSAAVVPQEPAINSVARRDSEHDMDRKEDLERGSPIVEHYTLPEEQPAHGYRPPIEYSSIGAFFGSVGRRFKSIWTRRFALSFLFGQIVSLCITCTNVTTSELVARNWSLPTTQTFFLYVAP